MYSPVQIPPGRYCNTDPLTGYIEIPDIYTGKPLYPYLPSHANIFQSVSDNLQQLQHISPQIITGSTHIKLPEERIRSVNIKDYHWVDNPSPFATTFVSWLLVPKKHIRHSKARYLIKNTSIPPLSASLLHDNTPRIYSNLGYFVTPELIYADRPKSTPWAFNKRYPEFSIQTPLSPFLGFYYHDTGEKIFSTVADMDRGAVGVCKRGGIEIINSLRNYAYTISLKDMRYYLTHETINSLNQISKVPLLFTPSLRTRMIEKQIRSIRDSYWSGDDWQEYREVIQAPGTYNIFVTNKGNGLHPSDVIAAIWKDAFPVVPFGYVISIPKNELRYPIESLLNAAVEVAPHAENVDYSRYESIYTASIPMVESGVSSFSELSPKTIMQTLGRWGFDHPNAQLSLESRNFSPIIRDAGNLLVETEHYIGNILFSGRYQHSIGVSLIDQIIILEMLNDNLIEKFENVLMLDDGSGTKVVYSPDGRSAYPLNIPCAGFRNTIGDYDGNYYSSLQLTL